MNSFLTRAGRLVTAVAVAVGAAGCVNLPDSSSVHTDRGAGVHQGLGPIKSSPRGPQPGATPREIVAGYLGAMLAFPSNPDVVREFMSVQAAQTWDPDVGIQVYENPRITAGKRVVLEADLLGSLDRRGSWTSTTGTAATLHRVVSMVRIDNQWRIANNPVQGTLINTEHFDRYYHQFSLYFFDPTFTFTAPDPVYLEIGTPSATATSLVSNLLKGPTVNMAGVVRSAAPTGARLTSKVSVSGTGSATVPLSDDVAALDGDALGSLAKQLAWTLRQERVGVDQLSIKVNGRPLLVPRRGTSFLVGAFHDTTLNAGSKTLYALDPKGRLVTIAADRSPQLATGPIARRPFEARSTAINPSNNSAALVRKNGRTVVWGPLTAGPSDQSDRTFRHTGHNLLRPSWDPFGLLWLVDMVDGRASLSVSSGLKTVPVPAANIEGLDVRAFAVSRDGMRLAAVLDHGSESRLVVAMIKRPASTEHSTRLRVVGVRPIVNSDFPLSHIRGLTWVNATTVAVLAQDSSSESQPFQVSVDGSRVTSMPGILPAAPVTIAAGPGSRAQLVIGTGKGLYVRTANDQWTPLELEGFTAPAYPS